MLQEMLQEVDSYHKFPHQNFSEALLGQSSFGRHKDKSWRKARVPCTWLQWNWLMRLDSVSYSQNRCREKTNAMQEFKGILTIWPVAWFVNSAQRVWVVCNPRWHFFQVIEGPFKLKLPACMYVWWVYIYIYYMLYRVTFDPEPRPHCIQEVLNSSTDTHTLYNCIYIYAIYTYTYHVWDFTVQTNKLNMWEGPIKTAPLSCQHFLAPFTVPLAAPLQAVNVSEGLGRATNLFLEVQGSIQLLFCRCQATSSHLKSQFFLILLKLLC